MPTSLFTRRVAPTIAVATAAALVLSGCGRADDDTDDAAAAAVVVDDTPATGTIEFWVGGSEGEAVPDFLADFEEANPDVTVNVTQIPGGELDTKILTAISTGTVPDVVRLYSQTQATMLATDGFAPVPDGLVDPESFFPTSYDPGVIDGVAYAVPWDAYATVFQYRKDLAEAAGVDAPTTWDELKTFATALQDGGSEFGISMDVGYDSYTAQALNEYVHQNGGSLVNEDATEWTINSAENVEALEYWGSFFEEGLSSPDGPDFLDTVPWFTTGRSPAKDIGPWFESWLDEANGAEWTAESLATAIMPAGSAGSASALGGGNLAVFNDAENADAAWKLVRYLAQPEQQLAWYEAFGNLPAVEAAWDEPAIADNALLDAVREAIPTAVSVPQVPAWTEVSAIIGQQMERVARGQATAQEALDAAQSQAESIGMGTE